MKYSIKRINDTLREEVLQLQLPDSQKHFIESVQKCLKEAERVKEFVPLALLLDGITIGFAMVGFFMQEGSSGRVWLDRFLIDQSQQGKGLGTIFLQELMKWLQKEYGQDEIYLSLYEDNHKAMQLYKKAGFEKTTERDIHGELIMVWKVK